MKNNKKDNTFICPFCNKEYKEEEGTKVYNGDIVCTECLSKDFFKCNICEEYCRSIDSTSDHNGNDICTECFNENYCECVRCGEIILLENSYSYHDDYYCSYCYDNIDEEDEYDVIGRNERDYYNGDKYIKNKKDRIFSCEIECNFEDTKYCENAIDEINEDIGISEDGSLGNNGVEFQTPKLQGENGFKEIKELCKILNDNKFYIDSSCGLHIHLDCADYMEVEKLEEDFKIQKKNEKSMWAWNEEVSRAYQKMEKSFNKMKYLLLFYLIFEDVILSYLPKSRRLNRYCYPLSEFYSWGEINNLENFDSLQKIWYREQNIDNIKKRKEQKYDNTRYSGINLHSLFSGKHIEIRFHSGTINDKKIINWIKLHVAILDFCIKDDKIQIYELKKHLYSYSPESKQEVLFEILNLEEETKNYFRERQKMFLPIINDNKEELNICAE